MAQIVTLSKDATFGGKVHIAGEVLSVSDSIYTRLKDEGKLEQAKAKSDKTEK